MDDLGRLFDARTIQRARTLLLMKAVRLDDAPAPPADRITATVSDLGRSLAVTLVPGTRGRRVTFERNCTCGRNVCAHMAAAALLALDSLPQWQRPEQPDLLDLMNKPAEITATLVLPALTPAKKPAPATAPQKPPVRVRWTLEPGRDEVALYVTPLLVEDGQPDRPCTPHDVRERATDKADRYVAAQLGAAIRTAIPKGKGDVVDKLLTSLLEASWLVWRDGTGLAKGPDRLLRAFRDPATRKLRPTGLPEGAALIRGVGYWCVDPGAGHLSRVELQVVEPPKPKVQPAPTRPIPGRPIPARPVAARPVPRMAPPAPVVLPPPTITAAPDPAAEIVERQPRIIARLGRVVVPSDGLVDVLRLAFDYGEDGAPAEIEPDDQRQFARVEEPSGVVFVRRDRALEQAALDRLAGFGFAQGRIEPPRGALAGRGTRVHWITGKESGQRWQDFMAREIPALQEAGWTVEIGADFGARVIEPGGTVEVAVRDAGEGWFDLDVGVEIDGERRPLLPILAKLVDRGGMAATRVIDGRAHVVLDDGSVLALPADRVERLLSVLEAMMDTGRQLGDRLKVPLGEADSLLDIDDLVARRADQTRQIGAYLTRLRQDETLPDIAPPPAFQGELRDYQRAGLGWLQSLRANGMAGILADDMGLGKTAQTLAHIALEHAEGRMADAPCLVVLPTSLVPNWVSEAARFTPHLSVVVLHGADRHERREEVAGADIVITTYGVVTRDLDLMKGIEWHMVVLDEAQAIKNPDSRSTRAVCALNARHRLCLSGTPVENNLGELWSQFAFLMPGLLGDRKEFQKRFRTPIEKRGDATRANLLLRRIRPFLLRRTKTAVAKELPPKTEVVRRIDLEPQQRDLYETIRLSVHETVRAAIANAGLSRSAITVIDALLKLRQVCCDPRLVKIPAAAGVEETAKLTTLVDMVREMVPEGRRILIFSQFTSMLDLIKAELEAEGIDYVELTGRTLDRATPVERFQAGEVPVFLISLKAGGRGLNLTAADTVIHYDPWWNPAAEDQATDRAYRIGQDKPVFVYKLIAANTVEERILALQKRKGNLSAATVEGANLMGALEDGDIDFLLGTDESSEG